MVLFLKKAYVVRPNGQKVLIRESSFQLQIPARLLHFINRDPEDKQRKTNGAGMQFNGPLNRPVVKSTIF